jgi:hypothetical protein
MVDVCTVENSHGSTVVAPHHIVAKIVCWYSFSLKVRSDPREANGIEPGLTFIGQLGLETTKLERVLATLLHDPTTERLVGRVALRDIAVAMKTLKMINGGQ